MSEAQTIIWPGQSDEEYKYWIYPIGSSFKKEPGNYIFAKQTKPNTWSSCYIGQTKNVDELAITRRKRAQRDTVQHTSMLI